MNNMRSIHVAIHGSCVSRDLFEFDNNNIFKIDEYIARNSIISSLAHPLEVDSQFYEPGDWQKRMVQIDCSKSLFSRLEDAHADYILIDLVDERFALNIVEDTCITWSGGAQKYLPNLQQKIVHASKYPPQKLVEFVNEYCNQLLSLFSPEQIILYRATFLSKYIDKEGKKRPFPLEKRPYYQTLNRHVSYLYDMMELKLNCHVIKLPNDAVAYEGHKWGLAPMHYDDQTYLRVLEAIKNITERD